MSSTLIELGNNVVIPYTNVRHVSKGGDNASADGSLQKPYATIGAATDSITDASGSKIYAIQIDAGAYVEDSLTLKPWILYAGIAADQNAVSISRTDLTRIPSVTTVGTYFLSSLRFETGFDLYSSANGSRLWANNIRFDGKFHSSLITCVADVSDSLAGKYLTFDGPLINWYIWFATNNGATGSDPNLPGRTGYKLSIATDATAEDNAASLIDFFSGSTQLTHLAGDFAYDFTASVDADQVPLLGNNAYLQSVGAGNSGFTVATSVPGVGSRIGTSSGTFVAVMRNCTTGNTDATLSSLLLERNTATTLFECNIGSSLLLKGPPSGTAGNVSPIRCRIQSTRMIDRVQVLAGAIGTLFDLGLGVQASGSNGGNPTIQIPYDSRNSFTRTSGVGLTSGSAILTGLSAKLSEGNPVIGDGIPANAYVIDSRDLAGTDTRISANATKTITTTIGVRTSVYIRAGASPTQVGFGGTAQQNALSGMPYSPATSGNWNVAPSQVRHALDQLASRLLTKESYTVQAGDIISGYVDLANKYKANSVQAHYRPDAAPTTFVEGDEGIEYTLSTYTDANGVTKTRLTFAGEWATNLLEDDVIKIIGTTESDAVN